MSRKEEFLEWLEDQDYWVKYKKIEDKWSDVELAEKTGITMTDNDEGELMIPRRDLRALAIRG